MLASRRVLALTGIRVEEWRQLARAFPDLPPDPGRRAARRRSLLAQLASRSLATGRWKVRLEGDPPSEEPTVYVSAHIGSLQSLRYCLRARGIAVANVLGPHNLDRPEAERQDRIFDRRHPLPYPHFFPAAHAHRLRTALVAGSLIVAADLPEGDFREAQILRGTVRLDPRPFRLAHAAGVPCRPAFLTLPEGRWTLTLGPRLPREERAALEAFACVFRAVAARSPVDLDGVVYLNLARQGVAGKALGSSGTGGAKAPPLRLFERLHDLVERLLRRAQP